jgi:ABC-type nickel/cobalt efflux system permease component RcnA
MWHNPINNVLFKSAKYEREGQSLSLEPYIFHVLGATKLISMLANSSLFQNHSSQFNLRSSSLFLILTFLPTYYSFRGLLLFVTTLSDTHARTHTHINRRAHTRTHTHTHTLGGTPTDEWSARRRDLCQTTHYTHDRRSSMPLASAFGAAWWPSIIHSLKEFNCPKDLYNLAKSYFSERKVTLYSNNKKI